MAGDYRERIRHIVASVRDVSIEGVALDDSPEQLGIDSMEGLTPVSALEDESPIEIPDECRTRSLRTLAERVAAPVPSARVASAVDA